LGNTSIFANYLTRAGYDTSSLINEITDDPFCAIMVVIADPATLNKYGLLMLYCNSEFISYDDKNNEYISKFELKHVGKCTGIKTISPRWLP
jgi:hypothetical protein